MAKESKPESKGKEQAIIFQPVGIGGRYAKAGKGGTNTDQGKPVKRQSVRKKSEGTPKQRSASEIVHMQNDLPNPKAQPFVPKSKMGILDDDPVAPEVAPQPEPKPKPKPKPKAQAQPKPVPKPKPVRTTAKQQSTKAATETMTSMVDDMRDLAEKRGGYLTLDDLDQMQGQFQARAEELAASLEKSFETFSDAKEKAVWNNKRSYDFDRLIVKKFSKLFEDEDKGRAGRVSRRVIPGFFMALEMMVGPEQIQKNKDDCQKIVKKIRDEQQDEFDWDHAYQSKEAEAVVIDVLVQVAVTFANFDKRSNWFIELVNANLAPQHDPEASDANWEMNLASFKMFMAALLTDLTREIANKDGRASLIKKHGAGPCNTVLKVVRQLTA